MFWRCPVRLDELEGVVIVEERMTQDALGKIVDSFAADRVGRPFRDEDGDHVGDDVFDFASELNLRSVCGMSEKKNRVIVPQT